MKYTSPRQAFIEAYLSALRLRDLETCRHSLRVSRLAYEMARELAWSEDRCRKIKEGALLHDLGKLATPDAVLLKPGRLNEQEWRQMRNHPAEGARLVSPTPLNDLTPMILQHHERWDGGGYPVGLKRSEICEEARVLALADAYDAMICRRRYHDPLPPREVLRRIEEGRETQFDPELADSFLTLHRPLR